MQLKIQGLTKNYGQVAALDKFTMEMGEGIYGIVGKNGAGKSTLMRLVSDTLSRSSGGIYLDNVEILRMGKGYRRLLGYMPQEQGMYEELTAYEFLAYMAELKEVPRRERKKQIEELLSVFHLYEKRNQKTREFSGGMKQRLLLGQALLGSPKILLLDEPAAGLDPGERIQFRKYVKQMAGGKIIFYSTHILNELETLAEQLVFLEKGRIVAQGRVEELLQKCGGVHIEDIYVHFAAGGSMDEGIPESHQK